MDYFSRNSLFEWNFVSPDEYIIVVVKFLQILVLVDSASLFVVGKFRFFGWSQ